MEDGGKGKQWKKKLLRYHISNCVNVNLMKMIT